MKRFLSVAVALSAVAFVMTSCLYGADTGSSNSALVSIVDGDAITGSYVIFDNGDTGYIAKGDKLVSSIPSSAYYPDKSTGEARAVIHFKQVTSATGDYSTSLELERLIPVYIKQPNMAYDSEIAAKATSWLSGYGITYTRDKYLNLQFTYPTSSTTYDSEHNFVLMYNPERQGYFSTAYNDDRFLYFELYHDAGLDPAGSVNNTSVGVAERIITFYLPNDIFGDPLKSKYYGIRVLYRGLDLTSSNITPRVLEWQFKTI